MITVDDNIFFFGDTPYFTKPGGDGTSVWGMVIEKAFTKVLGNYLKGDVGGFM